MKWDLLSPFKNNLMKRCIKSFEIHFVVIDSGEILSFVLWPWVNLLSAVAWTWIFRIDASPVGLMKMRCFMIGIVKK